MCAPVWNLLLRVCVRVCVRACVRACVRVRVCVCTCMRVHTRNIAAGMTGVTATTMGTRRMFVRLQSILKQQQHARHLALPHLPTRPPAPRLRLRVARARRPLVISTPRYRRACSVRRAGSLLKCQPALPHPLPAAAIAVRLPRPGEAVGGLGHIARLRHTWVTRRDVGVSQAFAAELARDVVAELEIWIVEAL